MKVAELRYWVVQVDIEKYGVWIKVYDDQCAALDDYHTYLGRGQKAQMWEL